MKSFALTTLLSAPILLAGCNDETQPPFEVSLGHSGAGAEIYIESVSDSVTLQNYQVNRGNCTVSVRTPVPAKFNFGESTKLILFSCNVKEVTLDTDAGSFSYSF